MHEYEQQLLQFKELVIVQSSVTMAMLLFVTIFSWLVIHPMVWSEDEFSLETEEEQLMNLEMITAHTVPVILAVVNMYVLSDAIVYNEHWWVALLVCNIYIVWNYIYYTITGESIYFVFEWDYEFEEPVALLVKILGLDAFIMLLYFLNVRSVQGALGRTGPSNFWSTA